MFRSSHTLRENDSDVVKTKVSGKMLAEEYGPLVASFFFYMVID